MVKETSTLEADYTTLIKKYKLPPFKNLVEDFEIDKLDRQTFTLLRIIRKILMEKVVNTITFLEMISNPVNSPKVYLPFIRNINAEDRKLVDEVYSDLGILSVSSLELEVDYAEKREAEMIKEIFRVWGIAKPKLRIILAHIKKPNNNNDNANKKDKSYFG